MRRQRGTNLFWRIGPLDARVEAFGVLAEDHHVYQWLVKGSARVFADEVQRVAGERNAWTNAGVEMKALPHGDNGAEIGVALAAEFRREFGFGLLLWLRCDGAKQSQLVFGQ